MQYLAKPCNTMQYYASLITADGAYHCPVGSIMAIFFFLISELIFTHFLVNTYFPNQGGQGLSVALSALNAFNLLQPMGVVYNLLLLVRIIIRCGQDMTRYGGGVQHTALCEKIQSNYRTRVRSLAMLVSD